MGKVFVDVGISLNGFIAGPNGGAKNPLGDDGMKIHQWMFSLKSFKKHLNLPGGGETGVDNDIVDKTFNRIGANIMGKNMFIEGEANWPEVAPFHCHVYILTHQKREPWERPGGTTFYFVNDDIHSVLKKAKEAAGNKDVRISGGADVIRQYLYNGLVDELSLHIAPIILGKGIRLFDNSEKPDYKNNFSLEIASVMHSPIVTHLVYRVINH